MLQAYLKKSLSLILCWTVLLTQGSLYLLTPTIAFAADDPLNNPTVSSISRANSNPTTADSVDFTVTFSEDVTGVNAGDFVLATTGTASGSISNVAGSNNIYTVTVNTVAGDGNLGLNVVDDDTIVDTNANPLGGVGAANGNFTGDVYAVDNTAPTVTNITSAATNGNFKLGDSINVSVTFSETVNVTGTPQLLLETGATDRSANYSSGSGSNTLVFAYTVQAGDVSADLDYESTNALSLNGGTILDAATNVATLTLPAVGGAGSLGANKALVIDGVVPIVTDGNISISGATGTGGAYKIGDTVTATWNNTAGGDNNSDINTVTVNFSQFGGGAAVAASNNTDTWTATYMLVSGSINNVSNRNVSVTATDNAGNATTTADTTNATVDNQPPSVTVNQGGSQTDPFNSSPINFTAVFSDSVTGLTDGEVSLSGTASPTTAVVTGGPTTYNIAVSGMSSDGTVIASLNANVAQDGAGNNNTASTSTDNTVTRDATAPTAFTVGSVTTTGGTVVANKWNSTNTGVDIVVPVANDATLTGGTIQLRAEADGSFEDVGSPYTILVGDLNTNKTLSLTSAALEALTGFSEGDNITFRAVITDSAANSTTGSISATSLDVDQVSPTASVVYSPNRAVKSGESLLITATFTEAITGAPQIAISGSNTLGATNMTSSSSTVFTYTHIVGAGNGAASLALSVGVDAAGNPVTATPTSGASFTVDNNAPAAPVLSSVATDNRINSSEKSSITVAGTAEADSMVNVTLTDTSSTVKSGNQQLTGGATSYSISIDGTSTTALVDGNINVSVTATDAATNVSSATNSTVPLDTIAPTLTAATIASNNADTTRAKVGDLVTVTFTSSETLGSTPIVTIAGNAASVTNTSGNNYTGTYTMQSGDTSGVVAFTVNFADQAGNSGTQVTATTNSSSVTFDKTDPALSSAQTKTTTTIEVTFSENLLSSTVATTDFTVASNTVSGVSVNNAVVTLTLGSAIGTSATPLVTLVSSVSDLSGNTVSSGLATPTDGTPATFVSAATTSVNTINLTFSEDLQGNSATNSDFSVTGYTLDSGNDATEVSPGVIRLTTTTSFGTGGVPQVSYTGSVTDLSGNVATTRSNVTPTDGVAPTVSLTSIASNNSLSSSYAGVGHNVTLTLTSSETIGTPVVVFQSGAANVAGSVAYTNTSGNTWTAVYTTQSGDTQGAVSFSLNYSDSASNSGVAVTTTSDSTLVTFDKTAPTVPGTPTTVTPINSASQNWSWTVATDALAGIQSYLYRITGSTTVSLTSLGNITSFATSLSSGTYTLFLSARDLAGNVSSEVSSSLLVDLIAPVGTNDSGIEATKNIALNISDATLLANDTDTNTLTITGVSSAVNGSVSHTGTTVTFTPTTDYVGPASFTYTLSDVAGNTATASVSLVVNPPVSSTQVLLQPSTTVSTSNPQVVVGNTSSASTVTVPLSVTTPSMDVSNLVSTSGSNSNATIAGDITVNASTSLGTVTVAIPAGTVITGATSSWNGIVNLPQVQANSSVFLPRNAGEDINATGIVEVGFGDVPLTLSSAVRIVIPNQAGRLAAYVRSGTYTQITTVCSADTQVAGNALPSGGDCKIDVGNDLVIWTKHFTRFISYTQSSYSGAGSESCYATKPGAPRLLSATTGENSVTLTWEEPANSTYYLITYGLSSGAQTYGNANIGGRGTKSFTVNGLSGGTTYYFKIRAGQDCMPGEYSNELSATPGGAVVTEIAAGFAPGILGAKSQGAEVDEPMVVEGEIMGAQDDKAKSSNSPKSIFDQAQENSENNGFFRGIRDFFGAIFSFFGGLFGR